MLAARAAASNGEKGKTQSRIIPEQITDPHRASIIVIPEEEAKTPDSDILVLEEQVTDIIPEEEAKMDSGILVLEEQEQVTDTPEEEKAKMPDLQIPVSVAKAQKDGKTNRPEKLTPIVLL